MRTHPSSAPAPDQAPSGAVLRLAGAIWPAFRQLAGGLGTAVPALGLMLGLAVSAVTAPLGVGLLLVPPLLRGLHALTDRERARLSRWGPALISPGPRPSGLRAAGADPTTRRELRWLGTHGSLGLVLGGLGVLLPLSAVRDISLPLWWYLVPAGEAGPTLALWTVRTWPSAFAVTLLGLGWLAIAVGLSPAMARRQARTGRHWLALDPAIDLSLRVAELTATRAAALDAHATELRRIERSLHDGTQNRIVAVTVLLGAARRMLERDPAGADAVLERAQTAAEQALAELRSVARGILPPVLTDRGLAGALAGLAAGSAVPCRVDVEVAGRCAASIEATAYFVVAEALTNIARHSGATQATVVVRGDQQWLHLSIIDDGRGGAEPRAGTGLGGIRDRIAALDGRFAMTSPAGGPTVLEVELPCGS